MDMSLSKLHELVMAEKPGVLQSKEVWGHKESDMTEQLNWTEMTDADFDHLDNHYFLGFSV